MAKSNQQQLSEEINKISLDEKIPVENDLVIAADKNELSVEDEYMINCLNQLDDHEVDIEKIADASHQFLLANAIKNAKQMLKECEEDGKVFLMKKKERKK